MRNSHKSLSIHAIDVIDLISIQAAHVNVYVFLPVPKVRVKVRRYKVTGETSFPTESASAEVFAHCSISLSQLMFFRLKQSFLHESEGLSVSPGSNICGILRLSYGKETRSAKPILAAGRETKHQNVEGGQKSRKRSFSLLVVLEARIILI